jgi:outer membrane lipoprotein carrier protein
MNKKTKKQTLLLILLFTLSFALACAPTFASASGELSIVISNLQMKYESITTLSADFEQEAYSQSLQSSEHAKGTVAFKKPGMMRWDYFGGGKIVSNGKFIWVYQPDLAQVIETTVDPSKPNITTDFLTGIGNLEKDFSVTLLSSGATGYTLSLVPKIPMGNTRELIIEIDNTFLLKKTTAIDTFNNETRVEFLDIKINNDLPNESFEYKEQRGIKIIRP